MNDIDTLYQDVVLDHKRHPRHYGPLPGANRESRGHNPLCGDSLTLRLREEDGRIADIAFEGSGCAICIASASLMTEAVIGRHVAAARDVAGHVRDLVTGAGPDAQPALGKLQVLAGLRRFPSRVKCATLAWHALCDCLPAESAKDGETP